METFGAAMDGEDDDFLDQLPDHQGDDDFMPDDDGSLHQQPGHEEEEEEEEDYFVSDDHDDDDYRSAQGDDDDDFMSAAAADDDDEAEEYPFDFTSDDDDDEAEEYPFPAHAPPAAASEAAIAALEAAEAPGDDCCPVCLQDGGGEAPEPEPAAARPWSRVAPCGHRFHAACVDKWLKVKLTCPVCRCPAAAAPPAPAAARPIFPDIVDEFLAVGYEESLVFDKGPRWMEYMNDPHRHNTWNSSWVVS